MFLSVLFIEYKEKSISTQKSDALRNTPDKKETSGAETLTSLCTAVSNNFTATNSRHASTESVTALADQL